MARCKGSPKGQTANQVNTDNLGQKVSGVVGRTTYTERKLDVIWSVHRLYHFGFMHYKQI